MPFHRAVYAAVALTLSCPHSTAASRSSTLSAEEDLLAWQSMLQIEVEVSHTLSMSSDGTSSSSHQRGTAITNANRLQSVSDAQRSEAQPLHVLNAFAAIAADQLGGSSVAVAHALHQSHMAGPQKSTLGEQGAEQHSSAVSVLRWAAAELPRDACIAAAALLPVVVVATLWRLLSDRTVAAPSEFARQCLDRWSSKAVAFLALYMICAIASDLLANGVAQRNGGHYPWEPIILVLIVDVAKLGLALYFFMSEVWRERAQRQAELAREASNSGGSPLPDPSAKSLTRQQVAKAMMRLFPSALLFSAGSVMQWWVLSELMLSSVVVWRNIGVLSTTSRLMIVGIPLQWSQGLGIVSILIAMAMSVIAVDGSLAFPGWEPLLLCICSTLCSDVGQLSYKWALDAEMSTNVVGPSHRNLLNVMLYGESIVGMAIAECVRRWFHMGVTEPLMNIFSYAAFALIALQVLMLLARNRVSQHAGGTARILAGGFREVVLLAIAPMFVTSRVDWVAVTAVLWAFFAMFTYSVLSSPPSLLPPVEELMKAHRPPSWSMQAQQAVAD
mmetsp:Transcript_57784/g.137570  ORF Transcript_57784/g.137570 Transcript_57784/m.137570 type:complete len:557 (-) Transcript_57784:61-1731(-)